MLISKPIDLNESRFRRLLVKIHTAEVFYTRGLNRGIG